MLAGRLQASNLFRGDLQLRLGDGVEQRPYPKPRVFRKGQPPPSASTRDPRRPRRRRHALKVSGSELREDIRGGQAPARDLDGAARQGPQGRRTRASARPRRPTPGPPPRTRPGPGRRRWRHGEPPHALPQAPVRLSRSFSWRHPSRLPRQARHATPIATVHHLPKARPVARPRLRPFQSQDGAHAPAHVAAAAWSMGHPHRVAYLKVCALARIHRTKACDKPAEEARRCSFESRIMVL